MKNITLIAVLALFSSVAFAQNLTQQKTCSDGAKKYVAENFPTRILMSSHYNTSKNSCYVETAVSDNKGNLVFLEVDDVFQGGKGDMWLVSGSTGMPLNLAEAQVHDKMWGK